MGDQAQREGTAKTQFKGLGFAGCNNDLHRKLNKQSKKPLNGSAITVYNQHSLNRHHHTTPNNHSGRLTRSLLNGPVFR